MNDTKRVVITGGPGTGKTTILDLLRDKGYPCHTEVSREVIKEQLILNSRLLPWDDLSGFSFKVNEGQVKQYKEAEEGKLNFYDRGIPDVLAYLRKEGIHEEELEQCAAQYLYHPIVFFMPPWPEIYGTDNERREDFDAMLEIHNNMKKVYCDLGYKVEEVPKLSPQKRIDFILSKLKLS